MLDRKNGELPPECTPNIDRSETKHVHQPNKKGFLYVALLLKELTHCIFISFGHAHNNIILKVGTHEGTIPCNWSPKEFTQRDYLQGLVP